VGAFFTLLGRPFQGSTTLGAKECLLTSPLASIFLMFL